MSFLKPQVLETQNTCFNNDNNKNNENENNNDNNYKNNKNNSSTNKIYPKLLRKFSTTTNQLH